MALIVVLHNDRSGSDDAANYNAEVYVNRRKIAGARIVGHRRADGWLALVRRFCDEAGRSPEGETK